MNRLSQFLGFIEKKKAAIFIGAGISRIAGCSGLQDICRKLAEIKSVQELIKSQNPASIEDVPRKELIAFCKSICNRSDEDRRKLDGIMREGLTSEPDKFSREYLPFIKKFKQLTPFPSLVTTNVDGCLAQTRQFDLGKIYHRKTDMRIDLFRNFGIFHIHGYVEDTDEQLWDLFDYPERYNLPEFKEFIIHIFREYSVLFLGYAFGDDDELRQLIAEAKKGNPRPKNHFALLPTDETHPHINEAIYRELFNIQIVKYGTKAEFVKLFSEWIDSNFNPVVMGKNDEISHLPSIVEGA
ncbi:MAG: SIR2 family protein [Candidatus Omnitrophica bacterium]|nr:SIR2 family protein [Candidatus Omnitrophota bacterium]MBU4479733.1 SIR2 family protein [Candidatus Omnitrophota bacterium]